MCNDGDKFWLGETIPFEIEFTTDVTAEASLVIFAEGETVLTKKAAFVDNIADLTITPEENTTLGVGEFEWLIEIDYLNGQDLEILPRPAVGCDEKPKRPTFKIKEV